MSELTAEGQRAVEESIQKVLGRYAQWVGFGSLFALILGVFGVYQAIKATVIEQAPIIIRDQTNQLFAESIAGISARANVVESRFVELEGRVSNATLNVGRMQEQVETATEYTDTTLANTAKLSEALSTALQYDAPTLLALNQLVAIYDGSELSSQLAGIEDLRQAIESSTSEVATIRQEISALTAAYECPWISTINLQAGEHVEWVSFGCVGQLSRSPTCTSYYWKSGDEVTSSESVECAPVKIYLQ